MKNRFIDYVTVVTVLLFVIAFWKFAVFTLGSFYIMYGYTRVGWRVI